MAPASNAATTSRPSTRSNPKRSGLHSVGIGALRESAINGWCTTIFADSAPRCTQFDEISGLGFRSVPKMGIEEATYHRWKPFYCGLMPSEVKRLRQLEEENNR